MGKEKVINDGFHKNDWRLMRVQSKRSPNTLGTNTVNLRTNTIDRTQMIIYCNHQPGFYEQNMPNAERFKLNFKVFRNGSEFLPQKMITRMMKVKDT